MVNKKLLEIGDRLGMKYPQIEMLNNEFQTGFQIFNFYALHGRSSFLYECCWAESAAGVVDGGSWLY